MKTNFRTIRPTKTTLLAFVCLVASPNFFAGAQQIISLPKPLPQATSLEEALNRIRNESGFSSKAIQMSDLSFVLWATGGRGTSDWRYIPHSVFEAFALNLYLFVKNVEGVEPGIYQYIPSKHGLKLLKEGDYSAEWVYASAQLPAPATMVPAVDFSKGSGPWSDQYRTVWFPMEVGLVTQTVRLAAAATGVGVGMVGVVEPAKIKDFLGIEEEPLLLLRLGYPNE